MKETSFACLHSFFHHECPTLLLLMDLLLVRLRSFLRKKEKPFYFYPKLLFYDQTFSGK